MHTLFSLCSIGESWSCINISICTLLGLSGRSTAKSVRQCTNGLGSILPKCARFSGYLFAARRLHVSCDMALLRQLSTRRVAYAQDNDNGESWELAQKTITVVSAKDLDTHTHILFTLISKINKSILSFLEGVILLPYCCVLLTIVYFCMLWYFVSCIIYLAILIFV